MIFYGGRTQASVVSKEERAALDTSLRGEGEFQKGIRGERGTTSLG